MNEPLVIYFASPMFNAGELYFNAKITDEFEKRGYKILLPQRDGFIFSELTQAVSKHLEPKLVSRAVQDIIYYLDMGNFVKQCDVVVGNFDEPIDEGIIVEAMFARSLDKLVIGLRTDVRSPYGSLDESYGGLHFFPVYQTDIYLTKYMKSLSLEVMNNEIARLIDRLEAIILENVHKKGGMLVLSPLVRSVVEGAKLLFDGIDDIHTEKGVSTISKRYVENMDELAKIRPRSFR